MNVENKFAEFSAMLSEDAIVEQAKNYGVEDKRKRKLLVVPFFWLMILSVIEATPRGCLSNLVAFFTASFSKIYPRDQVIGLSHMALSKKLSSTNWMFFRGVYNRLQVTDGKRHDSKFRFITQDPNILYLFDLGYGSFARFKKIADACSFLWHINYNMTFG